MPNFKFQYPGAYHNARYMAQAIYMLKMNLLMGKINWLSDKEKEEVKIMAEFISVFYVVWCLQGYLGVNAPMNDLKAMQQMRMYRQYRPSLVSDTCISSWRRHTWYLCAWQMCLVPSEMLWQLQLCSRSLWILFLQANQSFRRFLMVPGQRMAASLVFQPLLGLGHC